VKTFPLFKGGYANFSTVFLCYLLSKMLI